MNKKIDKLDGYYYWDMCLNIKMPEIDWGDLAVEQIYRTLKETIFLPPDLTTYKTRARKFFKETFKTHSSVLNWTPQTVSQWMNLAVEGLHPQAVTHVVLFYLYKVLGKASIIPFDSLKRQGDYINVLMVGAAASPYFSKFSDAVLPVDNFSPYRFISFDPNTNALEEDFLRHYNVIGKKYFPHMEIKRKGIFLSESKDCYSVKMINEYYNREWQERLKETMDLAILPTVIFGPGQEEEYVHFLVNLSASLKKTGVLIIHIDLFHDYIREIGWLIQAFHEIGLHICFPPSIITGSQDLMLYNYDKMKSKLLNIDIGDNPGINQIILIFRNKPGANISLIKAAKSTDLFLNNYFRLLF